MLRHYYFSEFTSSTVLHRPRTTALFFLTFLFSYLLLNTTFDSCQIRLPDYLVSSTDMFSSALSFHSLSDSADSSLGTVLKEASMHDKTLIQVTWSKPFEIDENDKT
ncbi:hypothetical protein Ccrd_000394 [Cynara cardunculus var. scolymus]|uniref:Uncharacterized protein n=1 Tax=Cynara cardunculus var. scolymus TaxID=59895 RepID=A0A124SDN3_CYNCS|nr:hypothetical protein Ccrd_000394 [Cynara cardunculus var. scolymus]